jgi:vacuolar-type H+-ATPase subunit E/Vma4
MTSELVAILEKEAAAEIDRVLTDARAQAQQLVSGAETDAAAIRAEAAQRAEADRTTALTRAQSAAQLKAASLVLQTKDRSIAEVFETAHAELARVSHDRAAYPRLLRSLIKEAAAELSGRLVIEANPADADTAGAAAREVGVDAEVKPSAEVSGGVVVSTTDGRFTVQNTLASRLERVKPVLVTEVADLLWGRA